MASSNLPGALRIVKTTPLIGRRFGMLRVVSEVVSDKPRGHRYWHCVCDCGGSRTAKTSYLTNRLFPPSCGCRNELQRAKNLRPRRCEYGNEYEVGPVVTRIRVIRPDGTIEGTIVIDTADHEMVSAHRWRVFPDGYAVALVNKRWMSLHRLLMGVKGADHKDLDRLNNRRSNLRPSTRTLQNANRRKWSQRSDKRPNTSIYKGVSLYGNRWKAQITAHGRIQNLGTYHNEEDAARAYDVAARQTFGEFARCNFGEAGDALAL